MHDLQEAVWLHRLGHSLRRIAELLQTGRVTLRKYLGPIAAAGLLDGSPDELPTASALRQALVGLEARPAPTHERSSLEPWRDLIVAKRAAGASPKSVHDYLRRTDPDYVASVSAMKRFFVRLALVEGPNEKDVAIPVVTVAGEIAQVDFVYAGQRYDPVEKVARKTWIFIMTLGYSRATYAEFVFDQSALTWARVHIHAFEHFGGVPRTVVPDNLKAAVLSHAFGADPGIELNRSYRELARAYGFTIDPTPVRAPEKKGKVEREAQYISTNFLASLDDVDIVESQRQLLQWLDTIAGERVHGTIKRRPNEVFATEERDALLPLPPNRWVPVVWKAVVLHRDCHVQIDGALYSAPWRHIGKRLWALCSASSVVLFLDDERLYTHPRVKPGERSLINDHLPEHRREFRHRSRTYWEERALAMGEDVARLVARIFERDDVLLQLRRVQAVVAELERYPVERARNAALRALHFGALDLRSIRSILRRALDLEPLPGTEAPRWSKGARYARRPCLFSDVSPDGDL